MRRAFLGPRATQPVDLGGVSQEPSVSSNLRTALSTAGDLTVRLDPTTCPPTAPHRLLWVLWLQRKPPVPSGMKSHCSPVLGHRILCFWRMFPQGLVSSGTCLDQQLLGEYLGGCPYTEPY